MKREQGVTTCFKSAAQTHWDSEKDHVFAPITGGIYKRLVVLCSLPLEVVVIMHLFIRAAGDNNLWVGVHRLVIHLHGFPYHCQPMRAAEEMLCMFSGKGQSLEANNAVMTISHRQVQP